MKTDSTSSTPLVSIVIPCFNQEAFLAETIRSALSQTYPNTEILIVDDGSTDKSYDIASYFKQEGAKIICQPNSGVCAARNTGIIAAKGEYLLLLDGDDLLDPKTLEKRMQLMEPQVGIVVGYYLEINKKGEIQKRRPFQRTYPKTNAFYEVVRHSLPPSGWLVRKEVFHNCGFFDPFLKGGEDWDFLIRCSAKYQLRYDSKPHLYYRQTTDSASTNVLKIYEDSTKVLKKNSIYAQNEWKYFLSAQIGIYYTTELVFYKLWQKKSLRKALSGWMSIFIKHPLFLVYSLEVLLIAPFRLLKFLLRT